LGGDIFSAGAWRALQRAAASFSSPGRRGCPTEPWAEAHGSTLKRAPRGEVV
jgi:hypothetical protein